MFNIIVSVPQEVLNYSLLYRWQWKVKLANFVFYFLTSCSMPMQFYTDKFFHFTTMSLLTRNIFINETDIILPFPKAAKFCLSIFKFICNIIQTFFVVHLCTCLLQRHRRLFGVLLSRSREGWWGHFHFFRPQISVYSPLPSTFHPHDTHSLFAYAHAWMT